MSHAHMVMVMPTTTLTEILVAYDADAYDTVLHRIEGGRTCCGKELSSPVEFTERFSKVVDLLCRRCDN